MHTTGQHISEQRTEDSKLKIHVIEPHADDALGSAGGICYNDKAVTVLHTVCKSGDKRDSVCLDAQGRKAYHLIRKDMNIIQHRKYRMPDLHYDLRIKEEKDFAEKIKVYIEWYDAYSQLHSHVRKIVEEAMSQDAYLAFPMGLEHPMHILVMNACLECMQELHFDTGKIIIYTDHPYDFHLTGTGRAVEVRNFLEQGLNAGLFHCDDLSVSQKSIEPILEEIYGSMHYGEFDGSLSRTMCSYNLTKEGVQRLEKIFHLQCSQILFVSVQAWPFYRTGGLGEVAYGLCRALQDHVNDIRILMTDSVTDSGNSKKGCYLESFKFEYEGSRENFQCKVEKREYCGLIYYLMRMQDSAGQWVNFQKEGRSGNHAAVFCDALMQKGLQAIDYSPTICHCNEWQTALLPFLKNTKYRRQYPDLKMVYTIHFYGYKGIFPKKEMYALLGISKDECRLCISCTEDCLLDRIDLLNKTAKGELVSMPPSLMSCMRAGIEFADAVTTVSRGYAQEIQGYPDFADVRVTGIRNGVLSLRERMGSDFPEGYGRLKAYKLDCKKNMQRELGLREDAKVPIICMVTRLAVEKGIEMAKQLIPFLLDEGAQMIIVGDDSDKEKRPYASYLQAMETEYRGGFAYREFSEEMEYKTYAAADILLMPSLSEACGTTQMNAMQFGVIPVVSMLGSFQDTVLDYKHRNKRKSGFWDRGIGFYAYKDDCWVFLEVLKKVLEVFRTQPQEWDEISRICCETDFGWKNGSVYGYLELYDSFAKE